MPDPEWNSTTAPEEGATVYVLALDDIGHYVIPFRSSFETIAGGTLTPGKNLTLLSRGGARRPLPTVDPTATTSHFHFPPTPRVSGKRRSPTKSTITKTSESVIMLITTPLAHGTPGPQTSVRALFPFSHQLLQIHTLPRGSHLSGPA